LQPPLSMQKTCCQGQASTTQLLYADNGTALGLVLLLLHLKDRQCEGRSIAAGPRHSLACPCAPGCCWWHQRWRLDLHLHQDQARHMPQQDKAAQVRIIQPTTVRKRLSRHYECSTCITEREPQPNIKLCQPLSFLTTF
jgi:hypothetical protein